MTSPSHQSPILEVKNLKVHFPVISGIWRRTKGYVRAVDDLSFDLMEGDVLDILSSNEEHKGDLIDGFMATTFRI